MSLETRIEKLEAKCNIKHRCQLIVAVWHGSPGPTKEQSNQFIANQKEKGECERCSGVCVLNWASLHPWIWQQQGGNDSRRPVVEDKKRPDASFVIGKGYV